MNFKKSKNVDKSIRIKTTKRTFCLMLVTALFSTFSSNAQVTPTPPKTKTTSSSSYSTSTSIEKGDNDQHNSSVSISKSNDSYKFRASYHKSKNQGVKTILLDNLKKEKLTVKGNTYLWVKNQDGDDIFECKLTKGHLRMYVNTEFASKGFTEKINKLGNDLKFYISGTDPKKEKAEKTEHAKRELERAKRELEHAKRELERAERDAKRAKHN